MKYNEVLSKQSNYKQRERERENVTEQTKNEELKNENKLWRWSRKWIPGDLKLE